MNSPIFVSKMELLQQLEYGKTFLLLASDLIKFKLARIVATFGVVHMLRMDKAYQSLCNRFVYILRLSNNTIVYMLSMYPHLNGCKELRKCYINSLKSREEVFVTLLQMPMHEMNTNRSLESTHKPIMSSDALTLHLQDAR